MGRMSTSGTVHPPSGERRVPFTNDHNPPAQLPPINTMGTMQAQLGQHYHGVADDRQLEAAVTLRRFSEDSRRSSGGNPTPTCLEPPLTAGSHSQPSQSPQTPLGGNAWRPANIPSSFGFPSDPRVFNSHPRPPLFQTSPPFPHHISGNLAPHHGFGPHLSHPSANLSQGYPPTDWPQAYYTTSAPYAMSSSRPQDLPSGTPLLTDGTRKRRRQLSSDDDNSLASVEKKKKKKTDEFEPFTCFKPDCPNSDIPPRKAVSQFFGRNKACTQRMPKGVMVLVCRKHYQQGSYRQKNGHTNSRLQYSLIKITFDNADKFSGNRDWKITFGKKLGEWKLFNPSVLNAANVTLEGDALTQRARVTSRSRSSHRLPASGTTTNSASPASSDTTISNKNSKGNKKGNKDALIDDDVLEFAENLERHSLLGEHKSTQDCREVLEMMRTFSAEHEQHRNNLPLLEFHALGEWPRSPKEPLIETEDDTVQDSDTDDDETVVQHGGGLKQENTRK